MTQDLVLVCEVEAGSPMAAAVTKLWRAHSDTLGFFPVGAFEDAAARGELLAALDAKGRVAGYVLFRSTSVGRLSIVHLCVAPKLRGKRIAKALFDAVKFRASGSYEISVRCRRDFPAHTLWPRLGFVAVADEPAKASGFTITVWRFQLKPLPLLAAITLGASTKGVPIAIDANVFFDLDEDEPAGKSSKGLLAPWFGEFAELWVTYELLNEINRHQDAAQRARQRSRFRRFNLLERSIEAEDRALSGIRRLLRRDPPERMLSDARQLAMTIAAGVTFFVTRDRELLSLSDSIEKMFGVEIVAPHEIIRRFDELRREDAYRPRRLFFGAQSRQRLAQAQDLHRIVDLLHHGQRLTELRRETVGRVKEMLATPGRFEITVVELDRDLVALCIVDRASERHEMRIPYFAVSDSGVGRTASHWHAASIIRIAIEERREVIIVDKPVGVSEALAEAGFLKMQSGVWAKSVVSAAADVHAIAGILEERRSRVPASDSSEATILQHVVTLAGSSPEVSSVDVARIEQILWPAKIRGAGLPCFIVPIRPRWAQELFDSELARATLLGSKPQLVLSPENAYYRASRPNILRAPARIIWYVSSDARYPGSMSLRGCSYLNEVVVGEAKEVFRRFRRLGVYEWRDVALLAARDGRLMAFRFSKSEVFKAPVSWSDTQKMFQRHGMRRSQIQSPVAIGEDFFFDVYAKGMLDA